MTEKYSSGAADAARAELAKVPNRVVLTEEFAGRVNTLAGYMEDDTKIRTLFGSWDSRINYHLQRKDGGCTEPSTEWIDFIESIDHLEYVHLKKVVRSAVIFFECQTLGDLRELFSRPYIHYRIGPRGSAFGLLAFQKQESPIKEAESLTLGL